MAGGLEGRVALVTGASRGIGAAVAVELARQGAQVVAVARTTAGLEETDDAIRAACGRNATLLVLDLREGAKVDAIGPTLAERFGRLDILVGNAGLLGRLGPLTHLPETDWTDLWAVNVTANWRLMRTAEPLLRASDAGRAVFVSSGAAARPRAYWGPYGASKAALDHLVKTWAAELAITRVKVNAFNPGPVATRMRAAAMPGEDPSTIPQPAEVAPAIIALCRPEETRSGEVVSFR
ncbi:SDR family NAD(P)-dependent oxidoreductase [Elioraea sp.]|uniref:SDR family NAD(P)-dependent oxidoreductase n=1 Tax=Elioraea sp. TaxID=2185103 RepID=UPI00307D2538